MIEVCRSDLRGRRTIRVPVISKSRANRAALSTLICLRRPRSPRPQKTNCTSFSTMTSRGQRLRDVSGKAASICRKRYATISRTPDSRIHKFAARERLKISRRNWRKQPPGRLLHFIDRRIARHDGRLALHAGVVRQARQTAGRSWSTESPACRSPRPGISTAELPGKPQALR